MSNVLAIAASGMLAAQRRLEVSASNVANLQTTGALADAPPDVQQAYRALRVDQTEQPDGGTTAVVKQETPGVVATYEPQSPFADARGMIATPDVSLENEAVQQLIARYAFAANAAVSRSAAAMQRVMTDSSA